MGWMGVAAAARREPIRRAEEEEGAARPEDVATAAIADWARADMAGEKRRGYNGAGISARVQRGANETTRC